MKITKTAPGCGARYKIPKIHLAEQCEYKAEGVGF